MGLLIDGIWSDEPSQSTPANGKYRRKPTKFHAEISNDPSSRFSPEAGRYHLYVSYACPWASRSIIFRKLKKLENIIGMTNVDALMLDNGWELKDDPINHKKFLHEIYTAADLHFNGRVTVPVLWDKKEKTIVCNESAELIRMFNSAFNDIADPTIDYYPKHRRKDIDEINAFVYTNINNGVYKCGFATEQDNYNEAFDALFSALDSIEERLSTQRYLVVGQITEADWRLFTTLIRFDTVYFGHFKCNKKRLQDYHNIHNYMLELYQHPGIAETVDFNDIKKHYYRSQTKINPTQIVPKGPDIDFLAKHDRGRL